MSTTTEPKAGERRVARLDVVGLVRAARRRADTSQREMAGKAGVAASTVGRIEAGSLRPSLAVLEAVLAVAGIRLVALGPDGRSVPPMLDAPDHNLRDGAGRRYPSHLDTIVDPTGWEWWGGRYGLARPPETFLRNRTMRDVRRARRRWEVRVALLYGVPAPMTVEQWMRSQRRRPAGPRLPLVINRTGGGSRAGPGTAGTFAP